MANIGALIDRGRRFIDNDLWNDDISRRSGIARFGYGMLRIVVMTVREFLEQKASVRASALTYYTLLSLVPVLALAFAIAKGFGLDSLLNEQLRAGMSNSDVADYLIGFSSSALDNAKGGLIAGVGVAMLLYSVFKLLGNIEEAFNTMWCVEKSRSLFRKVADYMCIMLFGPIMLLAATSATIVVKSSVRAIMTGGFTPLQDVVLHALPYLMAWIVFTLLYLVMPNTRVKPVPAIVAGVVSGTAFQIVQWAYITFQIGVNKAGAIYGSFAFLPLLLTWLQITWTIVLAGCKIAFSIQNVSNYSKEHGATDVSQEAQRKLSVLIMHRIATAFKRGEGMPTGIDIANGLGLGKPLFFLLTERMKKAGLIAELESPDGIAPEDRTYIPAMDLRRITAAEVSQRLDSLGNDAPLRAIAKDEYAQCFAEEDADGCTTSAKSYNTPLCDL
ncbi:MAG: YihY/virulence factor BrkB family protein [Marinilabiliaceae bacterium]